MNKKGCGDHGGIHEVQLPVEGPNDGGQPVRIFTKPVKENLQPMAGLVDVGGLVVPESSMNETYATDCFLGM